VFQRKMAVEESYITEVLATKPDAKAEPEIKAEGNDAENGNGAVDDEIS
jgi:hypothetical protein